MTSPVLTAEVPLATDVEVNEGRRDTPPERPGRARLLLLGLLRAVAVVAAIGWVFFGSYSLQGSANLALRYTLVAASLVILTGWVGQISLAQAAFVGIGAFMTGVVVRAWGVPFPLTLPLTAGISAAAAALLGVVALRVRGLYLAVATLIFAWMVQEYLFNQPWMVGVGGSSTAPIEPLGEAGQVPFVDFTDRRTFYFILLAVTGATLLGLANLRDSKTGRAWFAVKGSEIAAASLGIDVMRSKLTAFAVSGFIAGMAGNLAMTHEQVTTATSFTVQQSLFYLSVAVVGGLTSLGGAVAAGVLFAGLEELFYRVEALAGSLLIVSSTLLAAVLLFFPAGLAGLPERIGSFGSRVAGSMLGRAVREAAGSSRGRLRRQQRDDDILAVAVDDEASTPPEPPVATDTATSGGPTRWEWVTGAARFLAQRRSRTPAGPTPDALVASMARGAEEAVPEPVDEDPRVSGLVYEPGTATKVELPPRARRTPILTATDITVRFGGLTAVDTVSLEVREGEIVGLIGPNGAGKTTLFNAISGLNEPTSGTVELFGHDVTGFDVHERAAMGMGRTFQAIQLFPQLSVFENLMVATHHRNATGFFGHLTASHTAVWAEALAADRVRQVMSLMRLEQYAQRTVGDLPFGVLRLVELSRAFVTGAPFIMLDEPASGLDNAETDRFMDLLLWARQSLGITMLLIEHDVRLVTSLSDYLYVIDRGKRIATGPPSEVQRNPAVIAAYLGKAGDGDTPPPRPGRRKSASKAKSQPRPLATSEKSGNRRAAPADGKASANGKTLAGHPRQRSAKAAAGRREG